MAFLECHFHSDVLGHASTMNVILPQKAKTQIGMTSSGEAGKKYPVLYLLHGLSDDESIWMRRTSIERYAASYDLVVVMPDGNRSFYSDMKQGLKYWTFLSEELPDIVAGFFPVSTRREDTFAAGNSMGGYGALKLALRRPDRFGAAVALSAVTDSNDWMEMFKNDPQNVENCRIFGSQDVLTADGNDLFALAEQAKQGKDTPRILQICGTEDFLYGMNIKFRDYMKDINFPDYEYEDGPGTHNWEFWDQYLPRTLKYLLG